MGLRIVPVTLKTANEFVAALHRHSRPVVGYKFAVGVELMQQGCNTGLYGGRVTKHCSMHRIGRIRSDR